MQLVSGTTMSEYTSYCETLVENGFENVYSNQLGAVSANAFRKDGKLYYTYYADKTGEARIIEDNNKLRKLRLYIFGKGRCNRLSVSVSVL